MSDVTVSDDDDGGGGGDTKSIRRTKAPRQESGATMHASQKQKQLNYMV